MGGGAEVAEDQGFGQQGPGRPGGVSRSPAARRNSAAASAARPRASKRVPQAEVGGAGSGVGDHGALVCLQFLVCIAELAATFRQQQQKAYLQVRGRDQLRADAPEKRGRRQPLAFLNQETRLVKVEHRRRAAQAQLAQQGLRLRRLAPLNPHVQQGEEQFAPPRFGHDCQSLLQAGDGLGVTAGPMLQGRQGRVKGRVFGVQLPAMLQEAAGLVAVPGRRREPRGGQQHVGVVGGERARLGHVRGGLFRRPELLAVTRPLQVRLGRVVIRRNQLIHDRVGAIRVRQRAAQQPGETYISVDSGRGVVDRLGEPLGGPFRRSERLFTPSRLLFQFPVFGRRLQEGGHVVPRLGELSQVHGQADALAPNVVAFGGAAKRLVEGRDRPAPGRRGIGLPGEEEPVSGNGGGVAGLQDQVALQIPRQVVPVPLHLGLVDPGQKGGGVAAGLEPMEEVQADPRQQGGRRQLNQELEVQPSGHKEGPAEGGANV